MNRVLHPLYGRAGPDRDLLRLAPAHCGSHFSNASAGIDMPAAVGSSSLFIFKPPESMNRVPHHVYGRDGPDRGICCACYSVPQIAPFKCLCGYRSARFMQMHGHASDITCSALPDLIAVFWGGMVTGKKGWVRCPFSFPSTLHHLACFCLPEHRGGWWWAVMAPARRCRAGAVVSGGRKRKGIIPARIMPYPGGWHRSRSLLCRCDAVVVGGGGKERMGAWLFPFPSTRNYADRFSPSGLIPVSLMVYLMYT